MSYSEVINTAAASRKSFVEELRALADDRPDVAELIASDDCEAIEALRAFVARYQWGLPERLDMKCADCAFYQHRRFAYGECRIAAPRASGCPSVRVTEWCAKFQRSVPMSPPAAARRRAAAIY
jgi:hypothetical protein